jgi:hypothetical protein
MTTSITSDSALRPWQLGPIKPELFAGSPHDAPVEDLARTAKRNFRFSSLAMHRHYDLAFVPLLVLMLIEPTSLLEQPFPKCRAFHCGTPVYDVTWSREVASPMLQIVTLAAAATGLSSSIAGNSSCVNASFSLG